MFRTGRRRAATAAPQPNDLFNHGVDLLTISKAAAAIDAAASAATGHRVTAVPAGNLEYLTDADLAHIAAWGPQQAHDVAELLRRIRDLPDAVSPQVQQVVDCATTLARSWLRNHPASS